MNTKNIVIAGLVFLALLFGYLALSSTGVLAGAANPTGYAHFQQEAFLQGATFGSRNQSYFDNTGRLTIGTSGTTQTNQVVTTCSIISNASAAATSTVYGYCTGVTGVTSADTVDANFATSTTAMQDQWMITGAKASTTAAAIDFRILNLSGRAQAFSAATTLGSTTIISAGH